MVSRFSQASRRAFFAVGLSLLGPLAGFAFAQQAHLAESCDEPIIYGCGKAQAMASYIPERIETLPAGQREAMGDTDVLHYTLDIEISNLNTGADTCTIAGTNAILIQSKSASLTQFTFRLRSQYTITSAIITDEFGNNPVAVSVSTVGTTTRVATLDHAYGLDDKFILTVAYNGTSASRGFGSIDVTTHAGTSIVETLSEAYFAYTWWPCKDGDFGVPGDNSDKATIDFYLTTPNNYVVPSNGLQVGAPTNLGGGRLKYHWHTDYPIATYLVSFAATNYNTWSQTYNFPAGPYNPAGSMPVQFFIYPENDNGTNRAAWEKCLNMLATYRTIYGEYPFVNEKYGIYNFNFGGGMEHQTITGQGTFSESVTAHELGHQWWGDMTTCKTWSDIWLNEGFADYTECLWEERKTGTLNPSAYFAALAARKPSSFSSSVYVPPADTADMNRIFSTTYTYYKGGWVLHMLRGVVGDAAFFQILADYRNAFQYSAATTDDFQNVASVSCGQDLTTFIDQWVYQIGAPAYQYGWQSVNVNGQNYLLARIAQTQTTAGYPNVFVMPVPLRLTIGGTQTVTVQNDARTEWFVVPVSGPVTALSFDPDQWILRTAATSAAYVPGPPKIVQTVPTPGGSVNGSPSPSQLTVWFHTNVNAVDANFSLVGANSGPQTISIVSGANVNPVVINTMSPLPADTYTLTVTTGVTAVNSGMTLDGEIADPMNPASLPSGDGVEGGNATIQFVVTPCNLLSDIDNDCDKDPIDVDLFVEVLIGEDTDPGHVARSDIDNSGTPDALDIQPFIDAHLTP